MRRLPLFLMIIFCLLSITLVYVWWQLVQVKKSHEAQLKHNQELVYRNAALEADIADLRNGVEAVQERARLQLGMIKRDEVFIQVMDQPSSAIVDNQQIKVPSAGNQMQNAESAIKSSPAAEVSKSAITPIPDGATRPAAAQ
jgi:cell division protein FtsB